MALAFIPGGTGSISGDPDHSMGGKLFKDGDRTVHYFEMTGNGNKTALPSDNAGQNIFRIYPPKAGGMDSASSGLLDIVGKGKDNTVILPGNSSDYTVSVAAMTPADMSGYHQHGDINLDRTRADGSKEAVRLHNVQQVIFDDDLPPGLNAKASAQSAQPRSVIGALDNGDIKMHDTAQMYNNARTNLSPVERCRQEAVEGAKDAIITASVKAMYTPDEINMQFAGVSQACTVQKSR